MPIPISGDVLQARQLQGNPKALFPTDTQVAVDSLCAHFHIPKSLSAFAVGAIVTAVVRDDELAATSIVF